MQLASVEVRLSGDVTNTVPMPSVTVGEISILRLIHGDDSVNKIVPLGMDRRSHKDEFNRLKTKYTATNNEGKALVVLAFPGVAPRLPVSFRDIGIDLDDIDGEAVSAPLPSVEEQTGGAIQSVNAVAAGQRTSPGTDFGRDVAPPAIEQRARVQAPADEAGSATAKALLASGNGAKDITEDEE